MGIIRTFCFAALLFIANSLFAQTGGMEVFSFMDMSQSPRIVALGSNFLAIDDGDLNTAVKSPSMIDKRIHNHLALGYTDYFAGINMGNFAYSRTFNKVGSFAGNMQFVNYGSMHYADITGDTSGTFKASDYMYTLGWGRRLTPLFGLGANVRVIYSKLETYTSLGLAVDVSARYTSKDSLFCGIVNANYIGAQIKPYIEGDSYPLPFEIQAGISKRLAHMPLTFSLLATDLQRLDLTYDDPFNPVTKINPLSGDTTSKSRAGIISDKVLRHLVPGGEFNIANLLKFRFSYNYQRRQEMKINDKKGMVGFSWGLGVKIAGFQIDYARSAYHLSGSPNFISITKNMGDFIRKAEN